MSLIDQTDTETYFYHNKTNSAIVFSSLVFKEKKEAGSLMNRHPFYLKEKKFDTFQVVVFSNIKVISGTTVFYSESNDTTFIENRQNLRC